MLHNEHLAKTNKSHECIGYLACYYYVSPDSTLADGDKPIVEVKSGFFKKLDDALYFIENGFDGKELWNERYIPDIKDHFNECDDKYIIDDWSAGQWGFIYPYFGSDIKFSF